MRKIPCVIIRGGTSKGVYLHGKDVPSDPVELEKTLLQIFGSPDKRQIDGLGGADPLTSKVAIIRPSNREDCDVIYTYGQVAIDQPRVYFRGICGNISSGVGLFAVDEGLVKAVEPFTKVRIFNTNTQKILTATVPVKDGKAICEGNYSIAGVPGTGAKISLDFSMTEGAITGKLLPTGHVRDIISVEGHGRFEVSLVDCAALEIYVDHKSLGMTGIETPDEIDADETLLAKCEALRSAAAYQLGLISSPQSGVRESANIPHLVIVGPSQEYASYLEGTHILPADIDFTARMIFMQRTHKTYAGTGSICTSVAAKIPGTIVNQYMSKDSIQRQMVRIGHPGGIISVECDVKNESGRYKVARVEIARTARRIMDGYVYVRD